MPTLQWIGKEKIINHHLDVPYRILNHQYGFTEEGRQHAETGSGNKIIHGDNLEALKSLLPEYEGKITCIYIDPPYNTGNEGWVYSDNVSHPKVQKWLGEVVGKESDDLTRHDKWLCMMYPRLQLLHRLLADDGAIFISIDDNEVANLKLIADEIFGATNFASSQVWRRRASSQLAQNNISIDHEYILIYFKSSQSKLSGLKKDYKNYSNPDNDIRGPWTLGDLTVGMNKDQRPNQYYDLIDPISNLTFHPSSKRVWTFAPETMKQKLEERRVVFPKSPKGKPMLKRFLSELKSDINPLSTWLSNDVYNIGLNSEGTKAIQYIFGEKTFDYPKPISLIELIISQITNKNAIILDSFAGSGTTAHAVLNLNKRDGGNRKFILVELEDYAETITAERVKRVMHGYADVEGTNGSFDFYTVGEPLFDDDHNLNEAIPTEKIREYIWYSETRSKSPLMNTDSPFLGIHDDTGYYFIYDKTRLTALDYDSLAEYVTQKSERYVIYADNCLLPERFMREKNIEFKKIPRNITRF